MKSETPTKVVSQYARSHNKIMTYLYASPEMKAFILYSATIYVLVVVYVIINTHTHTIIHTHTHTGHQMYL